MIQQFDPLDLGSKTFPLPLLINKLNRIGSGEAYSPWPWEGTRLNHLDFPLKPIEPSTHHFPWDLRVVG